MSLLGKHVLHLSKKIGSREGGGPGERSASLYITSIMKKIAGEVQVQSFRCWRSDTPALIFILAACVSGYLLFPVSSRLSFLLTLMSFLVFQMETYTWSVVSRLQRRSEARNLICKVPPSGKTGGKDRRLVIITANYDSARTSPFSRGPLARGYRVFYIMLLMSMLLLTALTLAGIFAKLARVSERTVRLAWVFTSPFALYVFTFAMLLTLGELFGRSSPGANDNAAGVGVMLSLLEAIHENSMERTEVWAIATARGFAGGRGMAELIRRFKSQMKGALIINIDHPGCGEIRILKREGPILGFSPGFATRKLLKRVSKRRSIPLKYGVCRVKKSDAMVARARGLKALTIAGTRGGSYVGWRSSADVYERISHKSLEEAKRLALLILSEIDGS